MPSKKTKETDHKRTIRLAIKLVVELSYSIALVKATVDLINNIVDCNPCADTSDYEPVPLEKSLTVIK